MNFDVIIIGGGAAGFFTAINIAEQNPSLKIAILEKNKEVLSKVKISGGGRCNVTNSIYFPSELVKNYPRGHKELLSSFHRFGCEDTIKWFKNKGIDLKTEEDGRVFPISNSSQTIIDCFLKEVKRLKITLFTSESVHNLQKNVHLWQITTQKNVFLAEKVIICTGSSPKIWNLLQELGHTIISPVPSLFTFNTSDSFIENLSGIAVLAEVSLFDKNAKSLKINNIAPLLITHWGFSGPAILKLSAWGARLLADENYQCVLRINWATTTEKIFRQDEVFELLQKTKQTESKKMIQNTIFFNLPKRLWFRLLEKTNISTTKLWAEISKAEMRKLAEILTQSAFFINGKSTFKEEFVTAGGVSLSEINFKTYESKILKNLYFAGEVMDIDAITGGFNFQNAWTGGFIVAQSIVND